jgi:hypothetical protein
MKHLREMSLTRIQCGQTRNTKQEMSQWIPSILISPQVSLTSTSNDMKKLIRNTQPFLFNGERNNVANVAKWICGKQIFYNSQI